MAKNVLVVSKTETFTIKGLEMKINGIGAQTSFSELKVNSLEGKIPDIAVMILYTDVDIAQESKTLVYIKDQILEADKKVIVIGTKDEYEDVCKVLPGDSILEFFERPLVLEKLLDTVETYLSDEAQLAKRKSVLIVDDDVEYMGTIMEWLKDSYRVSMANSGINAITWLATNHADLILLDYEMPITTGPMVLEMLRSENKTKDIPVMFLTGNNDKESILKVVALHPVDYLLKTIDRKGLHDKLDTYFAKQATIKKSGQ